MSTGGENKSDDGNSGADLNDPTLERIDRLFELDAAMSFAPDDLDEGGETFTTGEYEVPVEFRRVEFGCKETSDAAAKTLDDSSTLDRELELKTLVRDGRRLLAESAIAEANNQYRNAKRLYEEARKNLVSAVGSAEARFILTWYLANRLISSKKVLEPVHLHILLGNLESMVYSLRDYLSPELLFKMYETLDSAVSKGHLPGVNLSEEDLDPRNLGLFLTTCTSGMEQGYNFSRLYTFLSHYTRTRAFANLERNWHVMHPNS